MKVEEVSLLKRIFALFLAFSLLLFPVLAADDADTTDVAGPAFTVSAKSALLMEADTGAVLFAQNEHEALPPASVTKVMSLLLVYEALEDGRIRKEDLVSVSETAAAKGGSQVYLSPGEEMSVDELIKCVAVASANDAVTALAELVAGSEEAFVVCMNERAAALGLSDTSFVNCTGLDDDGTNLTSAADIAVLSRALMAHEDIFQYTTIWMDSIRNGAFGLTNTNRLVRFYSGTNGLKTGSTSRAGFCISATAKRDGMQLIAVIMGAETSAGRNEQAKKLLDYGFANFSVAHLPRVTGLEPVAVSGGEAAFVEPLMREEEVVLLLGKGESSSVTTKITLESALEAPVEQGQTIGRIDYYCKDQKVHSVALVAAAPVARVTFGFAFTRSLHTILI